MKDGLRFGFVAGLFRGVGEFMRYARGAGPLDVTLGNCLHDVTMFTIAGAVLGWIDASSLEGSV